LSDGLLAEVPLGDLVDLLPGKRGEEQMWEAALPREGFRFVERELEYPRVARVQPPEFTFDKGADGRNGIAHVSTGLAMGGVHISFQFWLIHRVTKIDFDS